MPLLEATYEGILHQPVHGDGEIRTLNLSNVNQLPQALDQEAVFVIYQFCFQFILLYLFPAVTLINQAWTDS